jgi:hypothetical protein
VTTPFLRRYILALPEYRSIDFLGLLEAENLSRLQQWTKVSMLSAHALTTTGMEMSGIPHLTLSSQGPVPMLMQALMRKSCCGQRPSIGQVSPSSRLMVDDHCTVQRCGRGTQSWVSQVGAAATQPKIEQSKHQHLLLGPACFRYSLVKICKRQLCHRSLILVLLYQLDDSLQRPRLHTPAVLGLVTA